jgi:hypothetical protein
MRHSGGDGRRRGGGTAATTAVGEAAATMAHANLVHGLDVGEKDTLYMHLETNIAPAVRR